MYTVLDFETTGLNPATEQVIEIGAKKFDSQLNMIGAFVTKVKLAEGKVLSDFIKDFTGIKDEELVEALDESDALQALTHFISTDIIIAQFASFDLSFFPQSKGKDFICTKTMFNLLHPSESAKLSHIVAYYGMEYKNAHQAMSDVNMTAKVFKIMKAECEEQGIEYLNKMTQPSDRPLNYIPENAEVITV